MNIETELRAAVSRADADSRLLHEIVHGDAAATVDTEGGPGQDRRQGNRRCRAGVAAAATVVTDGVAASEAARDASIEARDAAQAAVGAVLVSGNDTTADKLSVKLRPGHGLQTVVEDAGGDERLRFAVTPQLNAGALIALARDFI